MHIDFNQTLIIQKMPAASMLGIYYLYVFIYVCCLKLIFMPLNMICISKHDLMLLATLLLRICSNYVLYGMYEIGDCLCLIVLTLFYYSSYHSFYVNFV